jgi:hypothetical protein
MPGEHEHEHESIVERIGHAIHEREARTEAEVEAEAATEVPDPITRREAFEEELMEEGRSAAEGEIVLDPDPPTDE